MGRQRQSFRLSARQRQQLEEYLQQDSLLPLQISRAHTLLHWAAGHSATVSAQLLHTTEDRVYAMRRTFRRLGLTAYLTSSVQGGAPSKLTPAAEAVLAHLVAEQPATAWTLRQLAEFLVGAGYASSISYVTVSKALKRLQLAPGRPAVAV
ncbi:helix-turn-helix domain-containing protein [Hymenobacter lucidus]|uniref:Helix-turn-helix domain-containing protein n=1 Tax=Hymenobacter lucidus TaxID=2880930 RepID=A0ABS8AU80_9BACT|nr:helix-turn-helix domain-containing protein [Hymenobacter lucidus]MCB2409767.1 helix-turn-helix domain-containing protein [Hymenobacter lucidus]